MVILAIDDNRDNLISVSAQIFDAFPACEMLTAHSGPEGIELANSASPDVILLDIFMPVMDGFEVCKRLKSNPVTRDIPVVFVTATKGSKADRIKALECGAEAFLSKPIDESELSAQIRAMVRIKQANTERMNENTRLERLVSERTRLLNESHAASILLLEELKRENVIRKESESRYRSILLALPDIVTIADLNGRIEMISPVGIKMFGFSSEKDILGKTLLDFLVPEDKERAFANIGGMFQGLFPGVEEYRAIKADGSRFDIEANAEFVPDADGNPEKLIIVIRDVSIRKQAQEALKVSEDKFKTMVNVSPDGIILTDLNGVITEVSELALDMFGFDTRDELIGRRFLQFIPSMFRIKVLEIVERTYNDGLTQNIEIKIRRKSKTQFTAEVSVSLIEGPDLNPLSFMIILRDVTERRAMETKQIHADRMATLGEMASGIAHEINQPLNNISMAMDNLLFGFSQSPLVDFEALERKSERIFENISRMKKIIDHIRAFSRSQDDNISASFLVNTAIVNAVSMLSEQFKHMGINLNLELNREVPEILGNTFKFEQVIINLLVNARDAVVEESKKPGEDYEMSIGIRTFSDAQKMNVEITDNGVGIEEELLPNIMLPFYTTKEEGKGTGLGLSICYQIIKEMKGTISVSSKPSLGTTVNLVFDI